MASMFLKKGKTRPISSKFPDAYIRDGKDIEDLKLFAMHESGSYQDVPPLRNRYVRLNNLVTGSRVGGRGATRLNGGSV